MPAVKVDILFGDAEVRTGFDRLIWAADHPEAVFRSFGEYLLRAHEERHAAGLAPDGTPWKPLAPSTWERKRGTKPLREEGDMLRLALRVGPTEMQLGTNDWKAAWHHGGTDPYTIRPKKGKALAWPGAAYPVKEVHHPGLPARPLVGISGADRQELLDTIQDVIVDAWSGR